jgi:hypothetical protein
VRLGHLNLRIAAFAPTNQFGNLSACRNRLSGVASMVQGVSIPFGAPDDGPLCIRHLPFAIPGDWHGFPLRVRAPQRLARYISKCMGLILRFDPHPTPFHIADNRLSAFVDVDVFDRDLLLSFAPVAVQRFHERNVGSRKPVSLTKVSRAVPQRSAPKSSR